MDNDKYTLGELIADIEEIDRLNEEQETMLVWALGLKGTVVKHRFLGSNYVDYQILPSPYRRMKDYNPVSFSFDRKYLLVSYFRTPASEHIPYRPGTLPAEIEKKIPVENVEVTDHGLRFV